MHLSMNLYQRENPSWSITLTLRSQWLTQKAKPYKSSSGQTIKLPSTWAIKNLHPIGHHSCKLWPRNVTVTPESYIAAISIGSKFTLSIRQSTNPVLAFVCHAHTSQQRNYIKHNPRKAHWAFITKSSHNQDMASEVSFSPHFLGGAGFFHLYDEQGYGQVKLFMKTWQSHETLQGQLLWVSLVWAQYTAGTGVSILEDTTMKLPHFESDYLSSLRDYLASTRGSLELKDDFVIAKQWDQDEFLVTEALDLKHFKPAQLKRINYCWMYLNVLLVSNIATAKGDYIDSHMFLGKAQLMSTKHKANQPKPNAKEWKQWRHLLLLLTHTSPRLKLKTPMGQWLVQWNQLWCKWPYLYDASRDVLLHHTSQGYTQHEKLWRDYNKNPS